MSSRRRLIDTNNEKEIKRIAEEERQQRIRDHDRIRASSQKTIEERKKIIEADLEEQKRKNKEIIAEREKEIKQRNEEHQRVMKEHRQFLKEFRQFMEENKKQSELTIEKIRKSSEQIEAFRKKLTDKQKIDIHIEKLTSYLNNNIGYYEDVMSKIKGERATQMKELVKTLKGYLLEINEIKGIDNKRPRLDLLYIKIEKTDKIKEDLDKSANIITSSGGSKLPVKRRAKPKPKAKPNPKAKPKAKPKTKPRSNKGVR
jgi:DNA repair exonuclease SbcCD ATPase subunit